MIVPYVDIKVLWCIKIQTIWLVIGGFSTLTSEHLKIPMFQVNEAYCLSAFDFY